MALRIEKAFGVNMDTLLQMQAWHDARARERSTESRSSVTRRSRGET
jgi:plasmid maintenance system antidote protein VapI